QPSPEEYLDAARRKILMARYHLGVPEGEYRKKLEPFGCDVPIKIQAHFEGVLYSAMAASDQLANALRLIWKVWAVPEKETNLYKLLSYANPLSPLYSQTWAWYNSSMIQDVRLVRN